MIDFLPAQSIDSQSRKKILLFGVFAGLAMLSKYQGAFLWIGVFVYVFLFNRNWLKEISFYLDLNLLVFQVNVVLEKIHKFL
jgi:4-amino-4-deoxy-L-arabinose transferase-like glycosyltransferase